MPRSLLFILAMGTAMTVHAASPWPRGSQAAVSLTYDDSPLSHLQNAVPALDRQRLKGTFFINPGQQPFRDNRAAWAKVAGSGHEVASHTFTHPCCRDFSFVPKGQGLEDLNRSQMAAQLDDTIAALKGIGVTSMASFAYPCGQGYFGEKKESYIPLLRTRHLYARGVGQPDRFNADRSKLDPYAISSVDGAKTLAELETLAEQAAAQGGWLVFYFHGVGGDHLAVDGQVHEQFLKYLAANPKRYWVAPFVEVGDRVFAKKSPAKKAGRKKLL